jgi:hypothetical protein
VKKSTVKPVRNANRITAHGGVENGSEIMNII